jgi:membrane-bound metal-dependent hydrolase YbcI (DUF457 family)
MTISFFSVITNNLFKRCSDAQRKEIIMPVTPLHIGIPGLPAYFKPTRVDITAAVLGGTLVDIDFFLYVLFGGRIHGFLHTIPGATVLAVTLVVVLYMLDPVNRRVKGLFRWERESDVQALVIGAFLGTYSHIILDSLIYSDVKLLQPFSDENPMYNDVGGMRAVEPVYGLVTVTTVVLLVLWMWRFYRVESSRVVAGNCKGKSSEK